MKDIISTHPDPAKTLFPPDRLGARPRHNILFTLEPLCILAALTVPSPTAAGPVCPEEDIISWLEKIITIADQIEAGPMDVVESSGERREVKISFFKRIMTRWRGEQVEEVEVDGSLWPGGWQKWSRVAWAMI